MSLLNKAIKNLLVIAIYFIPSYFDLLSLMFQLQSHKMEEDGLNMTKQ